MITVHNDERGMPVGTFSGNDFKVLFDILRKTRDHAEFDSTNEDATQHDRNCALHLYRDVNFIYVVTADKLQSAKKANKES